jgi:hypothetical protein
VRRVGDRTTQDEIRSAEREIRPDRTTRHEGRCLVARLSEQIRRFEHAAASPFYAIAAGRARSCRCGLPRSAE